MSVKKHELFRIKLWKNKLLGIISIEFSCVFYIEVKQVFTNIFSETKASGYDKVDSDLSSYPLITSPSLASW